MRAIKKLFLALIFLFCLFLPANADVMPYYVNNINSNSIGVYQISNKVQIYKEANDKSPILLTVNWDEKTYDCPNVSASNFFLIFQPKKNLAFLTVIDESEDANWVQVVYDKNNDFKGWIKKDDEFKFMNWRTFYNLYGRKYGLYYLKDAPEETKTIFSANVEGSQNIGKIKLPQSIKLNSVKGNWLLVVVYDIDKYEKIGWVKWRSISGNIYIFPNIK